MQIILYSQHCAQVTLFYIANSQLCELMSMLAIWHGQPCAWLVMF